MRTACRHPATRGFAILELVITVVIGVVALGVATSLTGTTTELAHESHVHRRAHAEQRRSLLAIGDVLRTAVLDSLEGFADGLATEPSFRRVLGIGWHAREVGDLERLEWRKAAAPVAGVPEPGAVWLVGPASESVIADRVPAGGFAVRQEGTVLAVRLTTYYVLEQQHAAQVTGETAVSLRN